MWLESCRGKGPGVDGGGRKSKTPGKHQKSSVEKNKLVVVKSGFLWPLKATLKAREHAPGPNTSTKFLKVVQLTKAPSPPRLTGEEGKNKQEWNRPWRRSWNCRLGFSEKKRVFDNSGGATGQRQEAEQRATSTGTAQRLRYKTVKKHTRGPVCSLASELSASKSQKRNDQKRVLEP